jgi:hypothetical protein
VRVLRAHRRQMDQRRDALVDGADGDGLPINRNYATTRFRKLIRRAGLPPVRLHGLGLGVAASTAR